MEQAERMDFRPAGNGPPQTDADEAVQRRVEPAEREVPQPVPEPVAGGAPKMGEEWRAGFPRQEREQQRHPGHAADQFV